MVRILGNCTDTFRMDFSDRRTDIGIERGGTQGELDQRPHASYGKVACDVTICRSVRANDSGWAYL